MSGISVRPPTRSSRRSPERPAIRRRRAIAIALSALTASVWSLGTGGAAPAGAAPGERLSLAQPPDVVRAGMPVPSGDADTAGMWSGVRPWPMVAIHAVVAQSGELVTYGATVGNAFPVQNGQVYDSWSPATGLHAQSGTLVVDSFCNIAVHDRDGTLFVVGGNSYNSAGNYDPINRSFQFDSWTNEPRWYSSLVRMPDNRLVVLGGSKPYPAEPDPPESLLATTPEVYDPATGVWSLLPGATSSTFFGGAKNRWWYPKSFVAPNGDVFGISYDEMFLLDPTGTGTIVGKGTIPPATTRGLGAAAAAVMFEPGRILVAGGGQLSNGQSGPATTDAAVVDIRTIATTNATVTRTGSLHRARNWINLVTQPDGSVIAVGGVPQGNDAATDPSLTAERWDPATETWTELAASAIGRSYHASAVLMPSGAIFNGGTGAPAYPDNQENAEFFYPPALFERVGGVVQWADRPEIRSMSGTIAHGGTLEMDMKDTRPIASMSLLTLGSNTHSVSMSERRVPVPFTQSGALLTATIPSDPAELPPGVYLLTAVDADGVPSPSQIVEIHADGTPGNVTVYGLGSFVPPLTGVTPAPTTSTTSTTTTTTTPPTTTTAPTPTTAPAPTTSPAPTTTPTTAPSTPTPSVPTATPPPATPPPAVRGTSPLRLMDTRTGGRTYDSRAAGTGELGPGETTLQVSGRGPVPDGARGAVVLNVTVTDATQPSYVTVWPTGSPRPLASNVNVSGSDPTPNMVVVPIGTDGRVSMFNQSGRVNLVVDLLGWMPAGDGFTGLTPARLLDTRPLPTVDGVASGEGSIPARTSRRVPIAGRGGVPAGAVAVALNVTATGPSADTYLTVHPSGVARPTASNLNVAANDTRANMVVVPLGADGAVEVFNFAGSTDVVFDVLGWFAPGAGFTGLTPTRLMDTRAGQPTVDQRFAGTGAATAGVPQVLQVAGRGGVPATGAGSVVLNITVTEPDAAGFATVHPGGTERPNASNLNVVAGQTVANLAVVPIGADGTVVLDVSMPRAHLVVDVLGWFPSLSAG